jgi:hypothetical protein
LQTHHAAPDQPPQYKGKVDQPERESTTERNGAHLGSEIYFYKNKKIK